jgi:uncharacterized protein (DUF1697 family)
MPRYVALLRGVSPMNAKMPALRRCFEDAGFTNVATVLSSGNVVFDSRPASEPALLRKLAAAMEQDLPHTFPVLLREQADLRKLLEDDAFTDFHLPNNAKRVVTFLPARPQARIELPLEKDGARILALHGRELYTAYVPTGKGAAFMVLIEKTFGKEVTTRTWDTVRKCAAA